jgi:hypothetical protein
MSRSQCHGKTVSIEGDTVSITGSPVTIYGLQNGVIFDTETDGNIGMGEDALDALTSGSYNTVYGTRAGSHLTSGSENSIFGFEAGKAATTADDNCFFGDEAGRDITGSANICMGSSAGRNCVSVANSVFIGNNAGLGSSASGASNVFIGGSCGEVFSSGSLNVGAGLNVMNALTIGTTNSGFGTATLQKATSASNNIGMGYAALTNLLTGIDNIGIGSGAGFNYTGAESGNIILGGNNEVAGENRRMRLGSSVGGNSIQKTYIAGIHGVTPDSAYIATYVDANGQMGVVPCNQERKENFARLEGTERLLESIPVRQYQYKEGFRGVHIGPNIEDLESIADELFPDIIARDSEGKPMGFATHHLPWLLVDYTQKLNQRILKLEGKEPEVLPSYDIKMGEMTLEVPMRSLQRIQPVEEVLEEVVEEQPSLKRALEEDIEPVEEELEPIAKEARLE